MMLSFGTGAVGAIVMLIAFLYGRVYHQKSPCPTLVDWKETPTFHQIMIDTPGVKRGELMIEVMDEEQILRVSGDRGSKKDRKGDYWHHNDRPRGWFGLEFGLPDNTNMRSATAKLRDGVITLTFSKLSKEKTKVAMVKRIAGAGENEWHKNTRAIICG